MLQFRVGAWAMCCLLLAYMGCATQPNGEANLSKQGVFGFGVAAGSPRNGANRRLDAG